MGMRAGDISQSKNEVEVERDDGGRDFNESKHILLGTGVYPKFLRNVEGGRETAQEARCHRSRLCRDRDSWHVPRIGTETHLFIQQGSFLPFDETRRFKMQ